MTTVDAQGAADGPTVTAVRGPLVRILADPFRAGSEEVLKYTADALLICADGRVTAAGEHAALRHRLPAGVTPVHYPDHVIVPGFVDAHVHGVQTAVMPASGADLAGWLEQRAFPEEERFADAGYAREAAAVFCDQLLRNGTTTALVFGSVHPGSADALFEAAARRNLRIACGKVLMDRNAPDALLDTADGGYAESKALLDRWHGKGRARYAGTPRFAPSCSPAQLEAAAALWHAHPGTLLHTHVSETPDEVEWARSLFPGRAGYLDIYDHYGLLGPGAVLAHGVHLSPAERDRCAATGTALAHCPGSNLALGSGLFPARETAGAPRPVTVGLGTDVGAGPTFSMLSTVYEAYRVAAMCGAPIDIVQAYHLATRGGAAALGLADTVGSLAPGQEADFAVLDPRATPLLARRAARAEDIEELLLVLAALGDDRAVRATYVAGRLAHDRDTAPAGGNGCDP
ncbi:guanine deaminase [Streptomyces olivaceiscleroticus]|uniref:Guanine deaminase n=1 Tax=Streptomyces olivaceiscleroticus TaxID=68245 RepID=A0ABP3K0E9_9ACTN